MQAENTTVPLAAIQLGHRFRRDMGDVSALAASIEAVGLLHPIVLTPDYTLVAGARRLEAVRRLGWEEVPARVLDLAGMLVQAECGENACRKEFLISECVAVADALFPIERALAQDRKRAGQPSANFAEANGESRCRVAAAVGISHLTLARATEVVDAARKEPERFGALVDEMDRTGRVNGVYKKLVTARQAATLHAEPVPAPTGRFRVIVADPPWTYDSRADDAAHRAANPYPSMSTAAICALPIGGHAEADCVLWLWTTNAHMREAFAVAEAWSFAYKTLLTWAKDRMGTGDWLRGQTEHCLMCVRGHPTVTLTNQTTLLHAPLREHSRKPDEFYALVEALCPGSKLEVFARQQRDGWQAYGNDTAHF